MGWRRSICTIIIPILAVVGYFAYFVWLQMTVHRPLTAAWSRMWYGDEAIREGQVWIRGNTYNDPLDAHHHGQAFLRNLRYAILALIGEVYLPSVFKAKNLDPGVESDPEGLFCRSLLDYFWVFPTHPMNRGTRQDMKDFVQYCRDEYPRLSDEERSVLQRFHDSGRVPLELLLPQSQDNERLKRESRQKGPAPYDAESMTASELEALLQESMNKSTWKGVVPEVPKSAIEHWTKLDLRRLPQIPAEWKEIRKALQEGRMAGFDATKLFAKELFNATPHVLAKREGPVADRIPILSDAATAISLSEYGWRMEHHLQVGARVGYSLADVQAMTLDPSAPSITDVQRRTADSMIGIGKELYSDTGYINTRRLPHLHAFLPDLPKELGMEEDVARVQSYLWMGALTGAFHYDEEANVYVQLVGEGDVFLVPQNYTIPFTGGLRTAHPPGPSAMAADPYLKKIPIHMFRIRAGQGVVFPAFTYHRFVAQSPERVAVNFFFMPKWRRMEYTEADWYTQEGKRPNGLTRLALRQIWLRSFARLWDEKRRGLVFNAGKNEYL